MASEAYTFATFKSELLWVLGNRSSGANGNASQASKVYKRPPSAHLSAYSKAWVSIAG